MKTKAEVIKDFMDDLRDLLKKYDAELSSKDHWQGFPECGEDVRMTVTLPEIRDEYGKITLERIEINLGCHIDGKTPNVLDQIPPTETL